MAEDIRVDRSDCDSRSSASRVVNARPRPCCGPRASPTSPVRSRARWVTGAYPRHTSRPWRMNSQRVCTRC
jgi:hypothetical protein